MLSRDTSVSTRGQHKAGRSVEDNVLHSNFSTKRDGTQLAGNGGVTIPPATSSPRYCSWTKSSIITILTRVYVTVMEFRGIFVKRRG